MSERFPCCMGMAARDVCTCSDGSEYISRSDWRRRAEAAETRLAQVEALAEEWERDAGETSPAWSVFGPQSVSVPFAVRRIRHALRGDREAEGSDR